MSHLETHDEVIRWLDKWRTHAQDGQMGSRMCWLSGPAGSGKTSIMQTVAEQWKSRGLHPIRFSFSRADPSRNHARSLVSALLSQILEIYPAAKEAAILTFASTSHRIEGQFEELIYSLRSSHPSSLQLIILLIDNLDECDSGGEASQRQIIQDLGRLVSNKDSPFVVLISSRNEPHLTMAVNEVRAKVDTISLDNQYSAEDDIRIFVTNQFEKIKSAHYSSELLDKSWPSASDVDEIVTRSAGQFIYAVTIMRFIWDSRASPKLSLQKVQGAAKIDSKSTLSQLDALYASILSSADDQQALKDILHAHFWLLEKKRFAGSNLTLQQILRVHDRRYTETVIHSCTVDMSSIFRLNGTELIFYHASLENYLLDQSRSWDYFVDTRAFNAKIQPRLFEPQQQNTLLIPGWL